MDSDVEEECDVSATVEELSKTPPPVVPSRKRKVKTSDPAVAVMESVTSSLQKLSDRPKKQYDEYEHFGLQLAAEIKAIPSAYKRSAAKVQVK